MSDEQNPSKFTVAIVAPSLAILGGQAVQARRLLDAWENDPEVKAFLVPVNPAAPAWLRPLAGVKYVRTLITQLIYLPLLARELRRADVVHVFSASYWSFLLAPLPAVTVARALGRPVMINYRSGEAPHHLRRSAIAGERCGRWMATSCRRSSSKRSSPNTASRPTSSRTSSTAERFRYRSRQPLRPRLLSTRNFEALYDIDCTLRAFQLVQRQFPDAELTLVGGGSQEAALRQRAAALSLRGVTFAGRVPAGKHPRVLRGRRHLRPDTQD